jgi:zinc protease
LKSQHSKLTLSDVNAPNPRNLKSDPMRIVIVTRDGDSYRDAIVKNTPSPIVYNSTKPKEIMDEDKIIQTYKINVKAEDVAVLPVGQVFQ